MNLNNDLKTKGSKTAKDGFKNEYFIIDKFNNWHNDIDSQNWLKIMGYNIKEIEKVEAEKIKGNYKSDIQVKVKIYIKNLIDAQNISIKLVSNKIGYNQIDKRYIDKYIELWKIPLNVIETLKKFTGEIKNENINLKLKDSRRMFLNEINPNEVNELINFFSENKILIITDLLKGRGKFAAEWMLVINKNENNNINWILKSMNSVLNYFGKGKVIITKKGNLKIGQIIMQRKGGDSGRKTANMLQFKINPLLLFDIKEN